MTALRAWVLCVVTSAGLVTPARAADPFEFTDGDRVVLLGSTLIEREQKYGYWELALTLKNRDKNVTFRNLGWSGDTVFGEARNGFDQSPKGFERMVTLAKELKPTVVVVCFGHNESFEGSAGVAKFTAGLEKLLDALTPTNARIVLMSPTPFAPAAALANPGPNNKNLALYRAAIRATAEKRTLEFVDLFEQLPRLHWAGNFDQSTLFDNGLHLSDAGYLFTAQQYLPAVVGLWAESAMNAKELRSLRAKIVEKNQLFFHRWRPQNETYLFGFRKHEQGKNGKEVAEFDPLVARAEQEIQELKKAVK